MPKPDAGGQLVGVNYWSPEIGPYLWHEFDGDRVRSDLAAIRSAGFGLVRILLTWDAFMPSDRRVHPRPLGQLGLMLDWAASLGLRLVPVLFAQSLGDCLMLPTYAIDPAAARPGVRVVSQGRLRSGGPRDLYTDPLMLELATRWLEELLEAVGGHPALEAWDLGHDPATTVRPLRFAHLASWTELMAGAIRARGDRCWMTLGAGDLLNARGVRLHLVAPLVDRICLVILPQLLELGLDRLSVEPTLFLVQLAQRVLPGQAASRLGVLTGIALDPSGASEPGPNDAVEAGGGSAPADLELALAPEAADHARGLLLRIISRGVPALTAWTWHGAGERVAGVAPFDRFPSLGRFGIVDSSGDLTAAGEVWSALAKTAGPSGIIAPWPPLLDEEDYYAHLPESALDLFASWRGAHRDEPAILD